MLSFDWCNNNVSIGVKMDWSILEERSSFEVLGLALAWNWIGALTLSLLLKLPPRKLEL